VAALKADDVLLVTKLDRLARSTRDLLNTLAAISERGAGFKSQGDPWADTTTPHGKLMITVLGGLAEFERHLILSRTDEGRKRAKARGVKFGRKPKLTKHQRDEALTRKQSGETLMEIARSYNVSHMTISRLGRGAWLVGDKETRRIAAVNVQHLNDSVSPMPLTEYRLHGVEPEYQTLPWEEDIKMRPATPKDAEGK
jgi:DNA invertase Pin-like site-specific DNA recombinase